MKEMDEYIKARNKLIPKAEDIANKQCGAKCKGKSVKAREAWGGAWNRTFHDAMNRLWREKRESCSMPTGEGGG